MSSAFWNAHCDPRVVDFYLMKHGPFRVLSFSGLYLFAIALGRKLMQHRAPFELRWAMFAYNILLIAINAHYLRRAIDWTDGGRTLLNFVFPDPRDRSDKAMTMVNEFYQYTLTKFVDYLDTVFFVLRKKDKQITGLHIYHHVSVPIVGWICVYISPTMPILGLFAMLNCSVHIIMYSYYALAALGPAVRRYLGWKRYLTQIQLIQFAIIGAYGLLLQALHRNYPLVYRIVPISQAVIYLVLFGRFYCHSYTVPEAKLKTCLETTFSDSKGNSGENLLSENKKKRKKNKAKGM